MGRCSHRGRGGGAGAGGGLLALCDVSRLWSVQSWHFQCRCGRVVVFSVFGYRFSLTNEDLGISSKSPRPYYLLCFSYYLSPAEGSPGAPICPPLDPLFHPSDMLFEAPPKKWTPFKVKIRNDANPHNINHANLRLVGGRMPPLHI